MRYCFPKDQNGNYIYIKTPEESVFDPETGKLLSVKLRELSEAIGSGVSDSLIAELDEIRESLNKIKQSEAEIQTKVILEDRKEKISVKTLTDDTTDDDKLADRFRLYYSSDETYDFSKYIYVQAYKDSIYYNEERNTYDKYTDESTVPPTEAVPYGKTYYYYVNANNELTIIYIKKDDFDINSDGCIWTAPLSNPSDKTIIKNIKVYGTASQIHNIYYNGEIAIFINPFLVNVTNDNVNIFTPEGEYASIGDINVINYNGENYDIEDRQARDDISKLSIKYNNIESLLQEVGNLLDIVNGEEV